ncbi:MAG: PAS domain S-box protein [Phormidium sp. BM_Day4_Bin.17]|nr:PAS domain S-box protein [Phormidium sp. BM_Day4_Bin.17]UCJ13961.1 MAG: PAS domain S-box protein [Phormidium sp. PBR-2020]
MKDYRFMSMSSDVQTLERPCVERVFECMSDAIWTIDASSGEMLYLNPAAERLYGRSLQQFQEGGQTWFEQLAEGDRDRLRYITASLEHTDESADLVLEYRIQRPDGEFRWVSSQIWQVSTERGGRLQGISKDLTEYRQTQQKKNQFEKLAANLPGVIYQYVLRPDGAAYHSYISPRAHELYELTPEEIQADVNTIWDNIHPDDVKYLQSTIQKSAEKLSTWTCQWRHYMPSGTVKWLSGISQPERRDNGDIVWDGVLFDITETKQLEAERDRFFDCALDLFCILSFDGYFKRLNPAWTKTLGYDMEQLKAQPVLEFVHPDDIQASESKLANVLAGRNVTGFENRLRTKSGSYCWLSWTVVSFPDDGVMYAIARDISDLKQAQLERERLIAIIDASPDIISSADLKGNITYFNRGGRKTLGLELDEDVSRYHIEDFLTPEFVAQCREWVIPQTLKTGSWQGISQIRRRDGTLIPTSQLIIAHPETPQSEAYLSTIIRDISDVQEIERQLRQKENFLRTIYDNQGNIVFVVDVCDDGSFRFAGWNGFTERIMGISSDEIAGKTPQEAFGPEVGELFLGNYRNCISAGQTISYEEAFLHQGRRVWSQVVLTPLFDGQGTIERLIGTSTDITERKEVELALQASEAKYRSLAQQEKLVNRLAQQIRQSLDPKQILETTVRELYVLLGVDRCYFLWHHPNSSTYDLKLAAEAKREELPGRLDDYPRIFAGLLVPLLGFDDIVRIDDVGELDEPQLRSGLQRFGYKSLLLFPVETGQTTVGTLACTREITPQSWCDRDVALIQVVCDRLAIAIQQALLYQQSREAEQQAKAKTLELEATLRQLQTTQAQLIQAEKMSSLGQLVAGVAHEINNPISFVFGNLVHAKQYNQDLLTLLELYRQTYPQPSPEIQDCIAEIDLDYLVEDIPKLFDSIETGAVRIQEIVRSLRTFSRLDESEVKAVDLHESIESTLTILGSRLRANSERQEIAVIRQYGVLPRVNCYAGQLNQVFMNLMANAIDAVEAAMLERPEGDGGWIEVTTRLMSQEQVQVRIRDNGTGMEADICDRIFDPFYTTKPVGKGTGLGLSISYQIVVERHGGTLICESTPGQGSTFTVQIPISCSPKVSVQS